MVELDLAMAKDGLGKLVSSPLVSTTLGGLISMATMLISLSLQGRKERGVAMMLVASGLRRWMSDLDNRVGESRTYEDSGGAGGSSETEIPDFSFENSLEYVAKLEPSLAKGLFDLLHQKDTAQATVRWTGSMEVGDGDETRRAFRTYSARLWLSASDLYDPMAKAFHWRKSVFDRATKERMREEIATSDRVEQSQASFTEELFKDALPEQ